MKYPIDIQDFESIISGNYVYVDKTALSNGRKIYFLSRPWENRGNCFSVIYINADFKGKPIQFHLILNLQEDVKRLQKLNPEHIGAKIFSYLYEITIKTEGLTDISGNPMAANTVLRTETIPHPTGQQGTNCPHTFMVDG